MTASNANNCEANSSHQLALALYTLSQLQLKNVRKKYSQFESSWKNDLDHRVAEALQAESLHPNANISNAHPLGASSMNSSLQHSGLQQSYQQQNPVQSQFATRSQFAPQVSNPSRSSLYQSAMSNASYNIHSESSQTQIHPLDTLKELETFELFPHLFERNAQWLQVLTGVMDRFYFPHASSDQINDQRQYNQHDQHNMHAQDDILLVLNDKQAPSNSQLASSAQSSLNIPDASEFLKAIGHMASFVHNFKSKPSNRDAPQAIHHLEALIIQLTQCLVNTAMDKHTREGSSFTNRLRILDNLMDIVFEFHAAFLVPCFLPNLDDLCEGNLLSLVLSKASEYWNDADMLELVFGLLRQLPIVNSDMQQMESSRHNTVEKVVVGPISFFFKNAQHLYCLKALSSTHSGNDTLLSVQQSILVHLMVIAQHVASHTGNSKRCTQILFSEIFLDGKWPLKFLASYPISLMDFKPIVHSNASDSDVSDTFSVLERLTREILNSYDELDSGSATDTLNHLNNFANQYVFQNMHLAACFNSYQLRSKQQWPTFPFIKVLRKIVHTLFDLQEVCSLESTLSMRHEEEVKGKEDESDLSRSMTSSEFIVANEFPNKPTRAITVMPEPDRSQRDLTQSNSHQVCDAFQSQQTSHSRSSSVSSSSQIPITKNNQSNSDTSTNSIKSSLTNLSCQVVHFMFDFAFNIRTNRDNMSKAHSLRTETRSQLDALFNSHPSTFINMIQCVRKNAATFFQTQPQLLKELESDFEHRYGSIIARMKVDELLIRESFLLLHSNDAMLTVKSVKQHLGRILLTHIDWSIQSQEVKNRIVNIFFLSKSTSNMEQFLMHNFLVSKFCCKLFSPDSDSSGHVFLEDSFEQILTIFGIDQRLEHTKMTSNCVYETLICHFLLSHMDNNPDNVELIPSIMERIQLVQQNQYFEAASVLILRLGDLALRMEEISLVKTYFVEIIPQQVSNCSSFRDVLLDIIDDDISTDSYNGSCYGTEDELGILELDQSSSDALNQSAQDFWLLILTSEGIQQSKDVQHVLETACQRRLRICHSLDPIIRALMNSESLSVDDVSYIVNIAVHENLVWYSTCIIQANTKDIPSLELSNSKQKTINSPSESCSMWNAARCANAIEKDNPKKAVPFYYIFFKHFFNMCDFYASEGGESVFPQFIRQRFTNCLKHCIKQCTEQSLAEYAKVFTKFCTWKKSDIFAHHNSVLQQLAESQFEGDLERDEGIPGLRNNDDKQISGNHGDKHNSDNSHKDSQQEEGIPDFRSLLTEYLPQFSQHASRQPSQSAGKRNLVSYAAEAHGASPVSDTSNLGAVATTEMAIQLPLSYPSMILENEVNKCAKIRETINHIEKGSLDEFHSKDDGFVRLSCEAFNQYRRNKLILDRLDDSFKSSITQHPSNRNSNWFPVLHENRKTANNIFTEQCELIDLLVFHHTILQKLMDGKGRNEAENRVASADNTNESARDFVLDAPNSNDTNVNDLIQQNRPTQSQLSNRSTTQSQVLKSIYWNLLPLLLDSELARDLGPIWKRYTSIVSNIGKNFIRHDPEGQKTLCHILISTPLRRDDTSGVESIRSQQSHQPTIEEFLSLYEAFHPAAILKSLQSFSNNTSSCEGGAHHSIDRTSSLLEYLDILEFVGNAQESISPIQMDYLINHIELEEFFNVIAEQHIPGKRFEERQEIVRLIEIMQALLEKNETLFLGNMILKKAMEVAFPLEVSPFLNLLMHTSMHLSSTWYEDFIHPSLLPQVTDSQIIEWLSVLEEHASSVPLDAARGMINFVEIMLTKSSHLNVAFVENSVYFNKASNIFFSIINRGGSRDQSFGRQSQTRNYSEESLNKYMNVYPDVDSNMDPEGHSGSDATHECKHSTYRVEESVSMEYCFRMVVDTIRKIVSQHPSFVDHAFNLYVDILHPYAMKNGMDLRSHLSSQMQQLPWESGSFFIQRPKAFEEMWVLFPEDPHAMSFIFAHINSSHLTQGILRTSTLCSFLKLYFDVYLFDPSSVKSEVADFVGLDGWSSQIIIWDVVSPGELNTCFTNSEYFISRLLRFCIAPKWIDTRMSDIIFHLQRAALIMDDASFALTVFSEIAAILKLNIIKPNSMNGSWFVPRKMVVDIVQKALFPLCEKYTSAEFIDAFFNLFHDLDLGTSPFEASTRFEFRNHAIQFSPFSRQAATQDHKKAVNQLLGVIIQLLSGASEIFCRLCLSTLPHSQLDMEKRLKFLDAVLAAFLKDTNAEHPRDVAAGLIGVEAQPSTQEFHSILTRCSEAKCVILLTVLLRRQRLFSSDDIHAQSANSTTMYFAVNTVPDETKNYELIYLFLYMLEMMEKEQVEVKGNDMKQLVKQLQVFSGAYSFSVKKLVHKNDHNENEDLEVSPQMALACKCIEVYVERLEHIRSRGPHSFQRALLSHEKLSLSKYKQLLNMEKKKAFEPFGEFFDAARDLNDAHLDFDQFVDIVHQLFPFSEYLFRR